MAITNIRLVTPTLVTESGNGTTGWGYVGTTAATFGTLNYGMGDVQLIGDGEVRVTVGAITNDYGILLGLDSGAATGIYDLEFGIYFDDLDQYKIVEIVGGDSTPSAAVTNIQAPGTGHIMRLKRVGSTVTAEVSTNGGTTWILIDTLVNTSSAPLNVFLGLTTNTPATGLRVIAARATKTITEGTQGTGTLVAGVLDTRIREVAPTTAYGASASLEMATYSSADRTRGLVNLSGLSSIAGQVTVNSASLYIRCNGADNALNVFTAHRVKLANTMSQVTWDERQTGVAWATSGVLDTTDVDLTPAATTSAIAINTWMQFTGVDFAALVQGWINGTFPNYGMLITRNTETGDLTANDFVSSEASDLTLRPYLVVDYTVNTVEPAATTYSGFAYDAPVVVDLTVPPETNGAVVAVFTVPTGTTVSITGDTMNALTDSRGGAYKIDHSVANISGTGTQYFCRRSNIDNAPTSLTLTPGGTAAGITVQAIVFNDAIDPGTITPTITSPADTSYSTSQSVSFTTPGANAIGVIDWSDTDGSVNTANTAEWTMGGTNSLAYATDLGTAGAKTAAFTAANGTERRFTVITYPVASVTPPVTVTTNPDAAATEASSVVHTVTLSAAVSGSSATIPFTLVAGTATGGGTDYTSTVTNGMLAVTGGSGTVTVSGTDFVVGVGVSAFTVTIPTATDTLDEPNETYTLTVGGVASIGTINDDDAAPTITGTSSVTVTAGNAVVITYTLSAASGRIITGTLTVTNGTKTGGVDFTTPITSGMFSNGVTIFTNTVSIPAGVTSFTLTIPTT